MKRLLLSLLALSIHSAHAGEESPVAIRADICTWKDGKKAVYLLQFDDCLVSQVTNAIPELVRRGMTGTFFLNPGGWALTLRRQDWETKIPAMGMVYGNHTMTHKGATSLDQIDRDIAQCQEALRKLTPDQPWPRLIAFAQPGGVPWKITPQEFASLLKKYNLVDRPPYFGYPFWPQDWESALKTVDEAIAKGEMGHHDFHGVGGDYGTTPMELFHQLLDKLETHRDILWITDTISWHKYKTEREAASLKIVAQKADLVRIKLVVKTNPKFYDLPLTLKVSLPADWTECEVRQDKTSERVKAVDGIVLCSVRPVSSTVEFRPVR